MKRIFLQLLPADWRRHPRPGPQAPARPQIATTKVDGHGRRIHLPETGNHQALFVVTRDGVIATDPVAYGRFRPAGRPYVAEIRKVTDKPIKYLVYSHHHYDHIAGGRRSRCRRANRRPQESERGLAASEIRPRRCPTRRSTTEDDHARRHRARVSYLGLNTRQLVVMRPAEGEDPLRGDFLPVDRCRAAACRFYPLEASSR